MNTLVRTASNFGSHSPVAKALGWALAHFVWEGAAIAAILAVTLAIFRGSSARLRYALACAALAAMPIVVLAVTLHSHVAAAYAGADHHPHSAAGTFASAV